MTKTPSEKITRAEMTEALLRSGYLLESRVETAFRQRWGYAEANVTYADPETGKSREFDVQSLTGQNAGPNDHDYLFGCLLIECINNPQPLVILTKEPLVGFLHHWEVKMSGLPVKIQDEDGWQRISDYLGMNNYHHYCKGRIGTQFCSFSRKKGITPPQWMATHEGSHFDSFKKLCDIVDYEMQKHFSNWNFNENERLNIEIYYPVVILQGDLIEARETQQGVSLKAAEHLQFRRSVATKGKEINYQIDVIREQYLPKFMEIVEDEIQKTARLLRRRHKTVRAAIDGIVKEAKIALTNDADSPQEIREIMDYVG